MTLALALAALVPLAVTLPLRWLAFRDTAAMTLILLGPAAEESLKFAAVLLALTVAAFPLSGRRHPEAVLPTWLFLAPWIVGGTYGMVEGLVVYAGQSTVNFALREVAHGAFAALGFATALWVWRAFSFPYVGVALGFGAALSAHTLFNAIAFFTYVPAVAFWAQAVYLAAAVVAAVIHLRRQARQEPASAETRAFLPDRGGRVHP